MTAQLFHRKFIGLTALLVLALLALSACQAAEIPATGGTEAVPMITDLAETVPAAIEEMATEPPAAEEVPTEPPVMEATATTAPSATEAEAAAEGEAELSVASDPELGEFLVGNNGMTLYMYTQDEPNTVNCEGDCLVNWPPLITQGNPVLGEGVDPALVGTAELPDGQLIVTYNSMPLYYWINDAAPGDTTGQGVGEVWYVVSPEGEVIGMEAPAGMGETPEAAVEGEAELSVASNPQLGEFLVGNNGMTLYIYTRDEPNKVNCEGDCLVNWPPLITQGSPVLGEGVDPALVGTAELPDGQLIVTYNSMPLYYWINDAAPGDTTGQGVGGVWYVISPQGEVIGQ